MRTLHRTATAPLSEGCTLFAKTLHPYCKKPAGFREGGCSAPKWGHLMSMRCAHENCLKIYFWGGDAGQRKDTVVSWAIQCSGFGDTVQWVGRYSAESWRISCMRNVVRSRPNNEKTTVFRRFLILSSSLTAGRRWRAHASGCSGRTSSLHGRCR